MDGNNYGTGLASIFAITAREVKKFDYHYDYPNEQWNVFDPQGGYVCSFGSASEARDFCKSANGEE